MSIILIIPALILSMYAQYKVKNTFNKFNKVGNAKGLTAFQVARELLNRAGLSHVAIEHVQGELTDHYDPSSKTLRLSDSVYNSTSLAAIGVAAHETGHAIQHDEDYAPLNMRGAMVPICGISSKMAMPLIIVGILITGGSQAAGGSLGMMILNIGIALYSAVVIFHLVTLPVEFNASNRAIAILQEDRILSDSEIEPARKVLNAAALTYVAAAITAVLELIRFLMIAYGRRSDD